MTFQMTMFTAALAMLTAAGCSKCGNGPGTTNAASDAGSTTTGTGVSGTEIIVPGSAASGEGSAVAPSAAGGTNATGAAGTAGTAGTTGGATGSTNGVSGSASGSVTVTGSGAAITTGGAEPSPTRSDAGVVPRNVGAGASMDNIDRKADGTSARGGGNVGDGMAHPTGQPAAPPKK